MRRRSFITGLGAILAAPLLAQAQTTSNPVVGVLTGGQQNDPEYRARLAAFLEGLQDAGWQDGRTLQVTSLFSNRSELLSDQANELIKLGPRVIHTIGTPPTLAAKKATDRIPIVFSAVTDPVGSGIVASLANPGGNITGFTNYEYAIGGKWLDLLKQIEPKVSRILVIYNPQNVGWQGLTAAIERAAAAMNVVVIAAPVRGSVDIADAIDAFAQKPNGGLVALPDGAVNTERGRIIAKAAQYRLPSVYPARTYVPSGGLLSYAVDTINQERRAATYVDRILRGADPRQLPVQAPTGYQLTLNVRTAKALGIELSPQLLSLADEVIE